VSEQSVYQQLGGPLTYLRLTAAAEALAPELEYFVGRVTAALGLTGVVGASPLGATVL
jgi:hypothetical protein